MYKSFKSFKIFLSPKAEIFTSKDKIEETQYF